MEKAEILVQLDIIKNLMSDIHHELVEKREEAANDENKKLAAQYQSAASYFFAANSAFQRAQNEIEKLPE